MADIQTAIPPESEGSQNGCIDTTAANTNPATKTEEESKPIETNEKTETQAEPDPNAIIQEKLDQFHALSEDDQLWFFIDDIVPTMQKDTEVLIVEDGVMDCGMPVLTLAPKSMEIFEEIANMPNHAAAKYPEMVPYFSDILQLYSNIVRQDVNPYWSAELLQPATPAVLQMLVSIQNGGLRGFLSLVPRKGSIPFRLYFGERTHRHDFVGVVHLYIASAPAQAATSGSKA